MFFLFSITYKGNKDSFNTNAKLKTTMYTVILHFGRGYSQIFQGLTNERAHEIMNMSVFKNRDCVNAAVFLQDHFDPKDEPDYPTE
jgi:hypothetical protein